MKAYLFIDFGSTFTKLTLIDIEKEEIIATAKSYTTVETDVANGYHKAYKELMSKVDGELDIVKKLACSSAAGGLKIAAIGLVPDLTAEAAKRAALGAGARVIKTYSYKMNNHEIEELRDSNADMILLAGGTDGGNTEVILHNAQLIADFGITKPVVVAGNKSSYDDIEKVFKDKIEYRLTENVMPKLNEINKGIFGCLMEQDFFLMFLPEFSGITGLAVCHIGLTGLGIVDDMGTQDGDLRHAFLRRLDLHRQFVVVGGGRRRFFCQFRIIQQPMFGEKIYSLRHLFQVKNLGPAHIPSTFSSLQFCLNVHQ